MERAFNVVIDLRGALAKICPFLRFFKEAMLVSPLRTPNYSR
jgi:hypothetical protein